MTEIATAQRQMAEAAGSLTAKLQTFHGGLTPDEQAVLSDDAGGFLIPMSFFRPQFPVSTQPSGQPRPKVAFHDISFTH